MANQSTSSFIASVFIGRFQPFHNGHLNSVKIALMHSKKLIIAIGGYRLSASIRGPWSADERIEMIKSCLSRSQLKRIDFIVLRDRLYCEEKWVNNLKGEVSKIVGNKEPIAIIGHEKDSSSYYLNIFPEWKFLETGNYEGINATDFRKEYFSSKNLITGYEKLPKQIVSWLKKYKKSVYYKNIKYQFLYINKVLKNKKKLLPFEVCNGLVICCGYILLVKSKAPLRKGFFSLPEAIYVSNENYKKISIKAVLNETKIEIMPEKIELAYKKNGVFSYRDRFPICKQTSYTYYYHLKENTLPEVFKTKETELAQWILLEDLYLIENQIYADHFQIIQWFL